MKTTPRRNLTARILLLALLVPFGSVWLYHYYRSTSWGIAEKAAFRYATEHGLARRPILDFSTQAHHRWNGVWLEPYFFFETPASGLVKPSSRGQVPPFLEVTVSGATGTVVATDISPRLKASYPIRGYRNH